MAPGDGGLPTGLGYDGASGVVPLEVEIVVDWTSANVGVHVKPSRCLEH